MNGGERPDPADLLARVSAALTALDARPDDPRALVALHVALRDRVGLSRLLRACATTPHLAARWTVAQQRIARHLPAMNAAGLILPPAVATQQRQRPSPPQPSLAAPGAAPERDAFRRVSAALRALGSRPTDPALLQALHAALQDGPALRKMLGAGAANPTHAARWTALKHRIVLYVPALEAAGLRLPSVVLDALSSRAREPTLPEPEPISAEPPDDASAAVNDPPVAPHEPFKSHPVDPSLTLVHLDVFPAAALDVDDPHPSEELNRRAFEGQSLEGIMHNGSDFHEITPDAEAAAYRAVYGEEPD